MLIEAEGLSVAIGGRPVLDGVSVRCEPGTTTALVGPSGSGKTTLLHSLGLLLPVDRGRILFDGDDATKYSSAARRKFWRDHAAFVLQDYGIMDEESVAFNITMEASVLRKQATGDYKQLAQVLERMGLAERQGEAASHLSGGEKQRLALARAVYKRATVLFVDEPTASLDAANRRKVIDLLTEFAANGCTVIVSTHDTEMINACDSRHEVAANSSAPRLVDQRSH
ncbi:putative ABC transport system ATP-binding protein [Saccharothrix tamanrassetensis]|uniref:Putative ABC transport system ATP-binding protein n=1 Tax=Saccharothrix tamanrassetensis TaxID=1051531 RepID=A0A841CWM0_9PSEU|nr:ATP-binding cassette domain-containing protein [Saccharothrix tamanrassetensis]MBB5960704.1 putative ABC transport system ATP-binding protein [Saccharothrix tamanrassetensis]